MSPIGESNNTAILNVLMPSNSLSILYPLKDGIVPSTNAILKVQVNNPLLDDNEIIFEIDTTPAFNSPAFQTSGVVIGSNIIEYNATLPPFDSTDFFWRARFNSSIAEENAWESSTFSLINNSPAGWSQGYFSKLNEATTDEMSMVDSTRLLTFEKTVSGRYDVYTAGITHYTTRRGVVISGIKAWER